MRLRAEKTLLCSDSNIYLNPLDQTMARAGIEMVRYADDFVLLCRSAAEASAALDAVRAWTVQAGLTLHPTKTRLVDAGVEGFDFLGYRFEDGTRRPRSKSLAKFKDTIRAKTSRSSGESLRAIITSVNQTLSGWFAYFKQSRRITFSPLDAWTRMRLRSILRRRQGGRGRGRGSDHQRWPNAFFAEHGLFCLNQAYESERQSLTRKNRLLESRMRKNRPYGSEGGGTQTNGFSLPL